MHYSSLFSHLSPTSTLCIIHQSVLLTLFFAIPDDGDSMVETYPSEAFGYTLCIKLKFIATKINSNGYRLFNTYSV